jgi:hypothetical protein
MRDMRALFQNRRVPLIVACVGVLALTLVVWRQTSNAGIVRRIEAGPSDRAIVYGISSGLLIQRGGWDSDADCDLACAAQFAIQIEGVSKRERTDSPHLIIHYDVRASYLDQDGQRQRLTVDFWNAVDVPEGWEVGEPLVSWPIHIIVNDDGLRQTGIE